MLKTSLKLVLLLSLLLLPVCAQAKESRAILNWLAPQSSLEDLLKNALQQSNIVSDFAAMLAEKFTIGQQIEIVVGGEGEPTYDEPTSRLSLPYSYLAAVVKAQDELVEDRNQALQRGLDMVEYTLYHMLGHILIADQSVDADEEAESIATWVMVTSWPNGGEQWLTSVRAFADASQKLDGPLSDYWHTHSLYKSRQRQLECAVLGSNPQRYEPLLRAVLDPQERRNRCVAYWQQLSTEVQQMLAPKMRKL